ncbi:MAG: PAS domain S-box protein [Kineosporiaceae bacterium]|nr:PAS domain S-box protein [Kineosporiaceae bacterium]
MSQGPQGSEALAGHRVVKTGARGADLFGVRMSAVVPRRLHGVVQVVSFVLGYALLAMVSRMMAFPSGAIAYAPESGLAIGVLRRTGTRRWPVYLTLQAGVDVAVARWSGLPLAAALAIAAARGLQAWMGAMMLRRLVAPDLTSGSPRWVLRGLIPIAVLTAGLGGAVVGSALTLGGTSSLGPGALWWSWTSAEALGIVSVLPVVEVLHLWHLRRAVPSHREFSEGFSVVVAQIVLATVCLGLWGEEQVIQQPVLLVTPVFWAAVRLGPRWTVFHLVCLNTAAVWATASGNGAFTREASEHLQRSSVQVFGLFTIVACLVIAEILASRDRAEIQARREAWALEHAMEGIALLRADGAFLRVNAAYAALLRADADALIGTDWRQWADRSDRHLLDGLIGQARREGKAHGPVRTRRSDGTTLPVEITLVAPAEADAQNALHCFVRDVSERQAAIDHLDQLFRLSPELLCLIGADGRFVRLNPAWSRLLGHPTGDLLGRHLAEVVHPEDAERTVAEIMGTLTGSAPHSFQNRCRTAAGADVWLHWHCAVDEERALVYAVAHDITASKLTEQALGHARDQAVEASRLKSQFLATMSHEIRTPMNGVIGLAELLATTPLDDGQRQYLQGIQAAGTALLGVINDILDFSKIEAGRLVLEEVAFDLPTMVREVAALTGQSAVGKGLQLTVDLDPHLPDWVSGDPQRLRQVLINLVGNAIKFTHEGSVTIRLDLLDPEESGLPALRAALQGGGPSRVAVRFEVNDTGVGMTAATVGKLFRPFTQADASTTRTYGGTGLGLAISRQLVEGMGGWISVQSAPGVGTTFRADVPLTMAAEPTPEATTAMVAVPADAVTGSSGLPVERAGGPADECVGDPAGDPVAGRAVGGGGAGTTPQAPDRGRLLLVEDNEINQTVAVGLVRRLGYSVEVAGDGVEALRMVGEGDYRAILMDCHMPRLDGYATTGQLRRRPDAAHLPIIAMTASAMTEDRDRCLDAGMDDYLTKPIRVQDLAEVLERWVGGDPDAVREAARQPARQPAEPSAVAARLEELTGDGSPEEVELVRRIARSFLDRAPAMIEDLDRALAERDDDLGHRMAHSLKGAAANLGAARVAEVCQLIEDLAEQGRHEQARVERDRLGPVLDGACAELAGYLGG